jgi:hypothetical protein
MEVLFIAMVCCYIGSLTKKLSCLCLPTCRDSNDAGEVETAGMLMR